MKKLTISALLCMNLTGCFYQSINSNDIELANLICEAQGSKVEVITASFIGEEKVFCINRSHTFIDKEAVEAAKSKLSK